MGKIDGTLSHGMQRISFSILGQARGPALLRQGADPCRVGYSRASRRTAMGSAWWTGLPWVWGRRFFIAVLAVAVPLLLLYWVWSIFPGTYHFFDIPLLPNLFLDVNANYRFNDWGSLSGSDLDTDTIRIGAALRFAL